MKKTNDEIKEEVAMNACLIFGIVFFVIIFLTPQDTLELWLAFLAFGGAMCIALYSYVLEMFGIDDHDDDDFDDFAV